MPQNFTDFANAGEATRSRRYGPFELRSYPCALCGSQRRHVVMTKVGVAVVRDFTIVECDDCRHHYVDPRIADEALGELYDDAYFRAGGFDRASNYFAPQSDYTRRFARDVVATVAAARDRPIAGARWLDFGCGPGHLLEALGESGAEAVGFDDSSAALNICTERALTTIARERLPEVERTFDVVSAIEVIEHTSDPRAFVSYLARFLRPGGILYVQTGNWNAVSRIAGTPYVMPEGHIQYFTPPAVRKIIRDCGLEEVSVLNRSWFLYRAISPRLRSIVPRRIFAVAAAFARRFAPGFAPNPVARRPA